MAKVAGPHMVEEAGRQVSERAHALGGRGGTVLWVLSYAPPSLRLSWEHIRLQGKLQTPNYSISHY